MLSVLFANIRFELATRYKSMSTYIYFLLFFVLSLMMGLAAGGAFQGGTVSFGLSNKVFYNSGLGISMFISLLSSFSLFIISPTFGQAVVKDYSNKFDQIIYSTPITTKVFLFSRFFSALLFMVFILSSMGLGIWMSTLLPFILKSSVTANEFKNYAIPYLTVVLPNIFIFGSIAFFVATRTKKMAPVYILGILMFMGWMLSGSLVQEIENKMISSLVDPFGIAAIGETTKYWSAAEQNTTMVYWQGFFLYNRILWCSLALLAFLLSLFTFKLPSPIKKKQQTKSVALPLKKNIDILSLTQTVRIHIWKMMWRQTRMEYQHVLKSIYFKALLLAGVGFMFSAGQQVGKMFGTNTFPVTYAILDLIGGSFHLFILIIITFFAGEVVWRDREHKLQQVIDSYPVPTPVFIFAKLLNLLLVVATLLTMIIFCGILIQLSQGYTNFEMGLYFRQLYTLRILSFVNIIVLAVFFQTLFNNKYLAHGAMILFYITDMWAPSLGFEHKLYLFNSSPGVTYSDMNGFGHFLSGFYLFKMYWLSLSLLFVIATILFWQRGNLTAWKDRRQEVHRRATLGIRSTSVIALGSFIGLGGFLFYGTNIKNSYLTEKNIEQLQLDYEKKYSKYKNIPQLHITAVKAFVDIFPKKIALDIKYIHTLKNKTESPIKELFIDGPSRWDKHVQFQIQIDAPTQLVLNDADLGVRIYSFDRPVAPGETIELIFSAQVKRDGTPNKRDITNIIKNGTFFNNRDFAIAIGYDKWRELTVSKTREKYGLPPKKRMPDIGDLQERYSNYIVSNSTWMDFEATISTDEDQIAIAPGYLQKEWIENGRKYFYYKMDQKIINFYAFLSGKYAVKTDRWKDVAIEIYFHPAHSYNIDKMIEASKLSLDYFTENFGPYQHKQFRILEFPRYQTFAQAFPNTIPFSEAVGFIAQVKPEDPKDVDYPFYITSHELAHQWWAHQVIGANVQGATMLSESFSQYSALMVLQKKYGREKMKRFLRHELEGYLFGRGNENEYEQPLYLNENQMYIHYQKGSLVFFALKEYLGENVINSALRDFLERTKFQEPPFTITTEFIDILKQKAPVHTHDLITDLLEKIVLFDNKPLSATSVKLKDGRYEVEVKISSIKWYSDKDGKETQADFNQEFDVGVTDDNDNYLYLKKHNFKNGDNTIKIVVDKIPAKAGVDPLNYIIDKTPDDNMVRVVEK